jgi:hypothetical protein
MARQTWQICLSQTLQLDLMEDCHIDKQTSWWTQFKHESYIFSLFSLFVTEDGCVMSSHHAGCPLLYYRTSRNIFRNIRIKTIPLRFSPLLYFCASLLATNRTHWARQFLRQERYLCHTKNPEILCRNKDFKCSQIWITSCFSFLECRKKKIWLPRDIYRNYLVCGSKIIPAT